MLTCSMPCEEASRSNLRFRYIMKNRLAELLKFDCKERIDPLSDEAKEFLFGLLCVDPQQRFNIDAALSHSWLQIDNDTSDDNVSINFQHSMDAFDLDWLDIEHNMDIDWFEG